ncbi:MAG: hypothetical protein AB7C89_06465 [Intestinibacillus sp.]
MTYLDYPILPLTGGVAYGATTQDGIPTPSMPVPLVNAIEAGAYRYARDGGNYQVALPAMRGIGDVRDTWDAETGTFTQRIGNIAFDGTEAFSLSVSGTFFRTNPDSSLATLGICNCFGFHGTFISSSEIPDNKFGSWKNGARFDFRYSAIGDIIAFKAWLAAQYAAGTPVIVCYQLATPVVSTITPELVYTDPVYDRTQADVDRARTLAAKIGSKTATAAELAEWGTDLRGAVNASDLNRIETATAFLQDVLEGYGYSITLVTKTDWTITDRPTVAQLARIRGNINALQAGFYTLPDWREIARRYLSSGEEATDYDILNAEEYDLHALGVWVERMVAHFDFMRSGDLYSGEEQL